MSTAPTGERVCPHCRYDLLGHAGESVRCPECGEVIPRELLDEHFVRMRLRARRGTNSADSAAILLFIALLSAPAAALGGVCCVGSVLVPWMLSLALAAWRLRHVPRCGRSLLLHQMYFLLASMFLLGAFAAALGVIAGLVALATNWRIAAPWNIVAGAVLGGLLAVPVAAACMALASRFADRAGNLAADLNGDTGE